MFPTWQQTNSCRTFKDPFRISHLKTREQAQFGKPRLAPGGLSSGIAVLKQDMEHAKSPRHKNL